MILFLNFNCFKVFLYCTDVHLPRPWRKICAFFCIDIFYYSPPILRVQKTGTSEEYKNCANFSKIFHTVKDILCIGGNYFKFPVSFPTVGYRENFLGSFPRVGYHWNFYGSLPTVVYRGNFHENFPTRVYRVNFIGIFPTVVYRGNFHGNFPTVAYRGNFIVIFPTVENVFVFSQ